MPILELRASNMNGDLGFLADFIYEKVFYGYTRNSGSSRRMSWTLRLPRAFRFALAVIIATSLTATRPCPSTAIPKCFEKCCRIRTSRWSSTRTTRDNRCCEVQPDDLYRRN